MVIGTAGHIDHGKSALVHALTGVHPDRLEEERRRGITLDLGFGHLTLRGRGMELHAGVVDVPGHERFVRTMLAGAGGVDLLLLVVAADAGVQPQTQEHFDICRLLGLRRGVIALTKCDLADADRRQAVRRQVAALVAGSFLESAPVVEVSLRAGAGPVSPGGPEAIAGLDQLRQALWETGQRLPARDGQAPFRLPVDRSFAMTGFGTVATGTLVQGSLSSNAAIALVGSPRRLRLRGIQVHGQPASVALAGQRTAVNLIGVEAGELRRGDMLVEPGVFGSTTVLDVELTLLPSAPPLAHRARLHFYLYAAERIATLLWLCPPDQRSPSRAGWAQLRLDQPAAAAPGDRFILRQLSPPRTVAGGRVLDVQPPLHRSSGYAAAAGFANALAAADPPQAILLYLRRAGDAGLSLAVLGASLGCRAADLRAWLLPLVERDDIVLSAHPPAAVLAEVVRAAAARMLQTLADFHAREPLREGVTLEQLAPPGLAPHWAAAAAERLRASGRIESVPASSRLRLPGRAIALAAGQQDLRDRLEAHFRQAGLRIPLLPEALAGFPGDDARRLVELLARAGVLIQCRPDLYVHAVALEALRELLAARKASQPRFGVQEFKQWTGLSRKFAIPLLEYLDRQRLTRRVGDLREIS